MADRKFSLSRMDDMALFLGLLVKQGAVCPACGYGTRATSKRWAKCKKCGERVRREAIEKEVE